MENKRTTYDKERYRRMRELAVQKEFIPRSKEATCKDCLRYNGYSDEYVPCKIEIESFSCNLAQTCYDFKPREL